MNSSEIKNLPLHEAHEKLGAKFLPFAGWNMPVQYSSIKEESLAVRNNCGVFDVSHMGEFFVTGKDTYQFLDFIATNSILRAPLNKAIYSPLCNKEGMILDDLIIYKIEDHLSLVCVNAGNIQKDFSWLNEIRKEYFSKHDVKLIDMSQDYCLMAIQGKQFKEKLLAVFPCMENLKNSFDCLTIYPGYPGSQKESSEIFNLGTPTELFLEKPLPIIIAKTGYTGSPGVEIFCPNSLASRLFSIITHDLKINPCGLGSRDLLRIEACYPLYGHELSEKWTPLDCGLSWAVKQDKDQFICKEALATYRPSLRPIRFILEKGIPREGHILLNMEGEQIGHTTSGTLSTLLNKGVGMGLIDAKTPLDFKKIGVNIRGKIFDANVIKEKSFLNFPFK